ncbi:VOC family protein [Tsukamurella sp. 8F]|uniref:VOC family protein n=1 Tax=unclassified Tsukamurella TaxID=2633480 RepID=UPI0023B900C8|nr:MULTISPECIES: VOC family protein [unclassified Tsukamurella]MDF0528949.1 VOC family protein [Tsukamurella sp. 8J]MDF0589153.1 VOC family protein [Tsukamurella sp. 8F]
MTEYTAATGAPVWFDLVSSDPLRAVDFYGEIFGWEAGDPHDEFGGYRNFSANGRLVAGLMPRMSPSSPTDVWSVYFKVDDAAASVVSAQTAGATVLAPASPVGDLGVMAVLADPAGGAFGLWQSGTHIGFTERGTHGTPYWFDEMSMDYAASTEFYRSAFGWELNEIGSGGDPAAVGPDHYSEVYVGSGEDRQSVAGIMSAAGMFGSGAPSFWQVYITVDDVAGTVARVDELGGEILMPGEVTPWGTLASVKDPMGAAICLGHPPAGM